MSRAIVFENLEQRRLMSVSIVEGAVTVNGDDGNIIRNDAILLRRASSNPAVLEVVVNGQLQLSRAISKINSLQIFGLGGRDTLTIDNTNGAISLPSGAPIQFDGGDGANTIVLKGGVATSSGFFQSLSGTGDVSKTINGQFQRVSFTKVALVRELGKAALFRFVGVASGTETVTLDNGTSSTDGVLRITHSIPGKTFATVEFTGKNELLLDTDQGAAAVQNPPDAVVLTLNSGDRDIVRLRNSEGNTGLAKLRVLTHLGADSVRIEAQNAPIDLNTGSGNDTIIIGKPAVINGDGNGVATSTLEAFSSGIVVSDSPGDIFFSGTSTPPDTNILTLDDAADTLDNVGELTSDRITGFGLGASIRYSGMSVVNLQLGSGNDTLRVRSSAENVSYNVNAGVGNDLFRLGSLGNTREPGGGNVNAILGPLSFNGGDGRNTIVVDDSGESADSTAIVTESQIRGLGMADVSFFGINHIKLMFGSGDDTLDDQLPDSSAVNLEVHLGAGES